MGILRWNKVDWPCQRQDKETISLENLWSTTIKNHVMIGELPKNDGLVNEEEKVNSKCQKGS
jgi:hypothetical protein